jgi:thymidylate synthase
MINEPVLITYERPCERVLFNQARDANPFFHLYEALWMLAGRNDVAPLAYYNSKIAEMASDDGKTFNGAYGYRWRAYRGDPDHDQLPLLIQHLKAKPESRRAVLSMWNVEDDLLKINSSKDVACNLSVMFAIRKEEVPDFERPISTKLGPLPTAKRYLDMTVTNRSNDMLLGMLGANYVHFTFLQEYMAAHLGVEVGKYHHFTNNLHVYEKDWEPEKWLNDNTPEIKGHFPLVKDPKVFDQELFVFVETWALGNGKEEPTVKMRWEEPFFSEVARPMMRAFYAHKERDYRKARMWIDSMKGDDWRLACKNWIEKRESKWEAKQTHED